MLSALETLLGLFSGVSMTDTGGKENRNDTLPSTPLTLFLSLKMKRIRRMPLSWAVLGLNQTMYR